MAAAVWSMNVVSKTRDTATGTAKLVADLLDAGVVQGHVTVTITADRGMRFDWTGAPGKPALTGLECWSSV